MSAMPSSLRRRFVPGKRPSRHHASQLAYSLVLILFLFAGLLGNLATAIPAQAATGGKRPSAPPPPPVSHMTVSQFLKAGQRDKAYHGPLIRPSKALTVPLSPKDKHPNLTQLPPGAEPATMKPISIPLSSAFTTQGATGQPLDVKGSDGRLEVQLPVGSLDLSHASITGGSQPSGSLSLQITQIHGHMIGQMNQLGAYTLQVIDSKGHPVNGIVLRTPATFLYHYQPTELAALDVNANHIVMTWPSLIQAAQAAKQPTTSLLVSLSNNPATHTLSGQSKVLGPGPFDLVSTPQVQSPPPTLLASVSGNTGQLSFSYPLQVPPGADGFAPQLSLVYSSMDPNGRPSRTSPANDEGDGWSLTLGSITMDTYGSTAAAPGTWYFLNDVANVSDRLVPDSTSNFYQTQHISHLRIQQIPASQTSTGLPCFNIWSKDGTYYQLGCTSGSVQFYNNNGTQTPYRWDVNKIMAPNDNNGSFKLILVSYFQDCVPSASPCASTSSVRDDGIAQITYGTGTSTSSISTLDGTIDFAYHAPAVPSGQTKWATAYGNNYHCSNPPTTTTLRCDDPLNYGSVNAPAVMSTLTLDSVTSYVGSDSTSSNTAYKYSFSYTDSPLTSNCYDPYSLTQEYCAGEHLLSSITPYVYQNGTAHQLPGMSFGYTQAENYYWDTENNNQGGGQYNAQNYWQYMTSYMNNDTGVGETIAYGTAYNNAHGTPWAYVNGSLDDRHDPLYCWTHRNDVTSEQCTAQSGGYDYSHPEDHSWSVQVVTSITATGKDSSSSSVKLATTSYQYQMAVTGTYSSGSTFCQPGEGPAPTPSSGQSDCVGDNWLPENVGVNPPTKDSDWVDYYHGEFRGFVAVFITSPANNLTVDKYYSTEGWFTPSSNSGNYNSGALQEEDIYEGNQPNDSALLQKTVNTYTLNPNSCRGDLNATYNPCEIMVLKSKTTTYEGTGSGNSNAPWVETDYTYDDFNPNAGGGLQSGYHNVTQQVVSSSNAPTLTRKWSYTTSDSGYGGTGWIYYTVDKVTHSEVDDSSSKVWQCQDTTYDQGAPSGVTTPDAGWPTTIKSYSDCSNQSSTTISSYQGYDAYGNPVASVDGVAAANSSVYSSNGCTLSSAPSIFPTSSWSQSHYTTCTTYDSYLAQPNKVSNALNQSSSLSYDYTQGALPTSSTDPNSQITSTAYSYDSNSASNGKRIVQIKEPGETGSYTSQSYSYSSCGTSSSLPCFEIESNSSLYPNAVTQTFYDALGRKVETRTPGPVSGDDTVVFTLYNDSNNSTFTSVPFEVADGSGYIDPASAVYVGTSTAPGGTTTFADALGRTLAVQDPNFGTSQEPGHACSSMLSGNYTACTNYTLDVSHVSGDTNTYETVTSVDANDHVSISSIDALGRTRYIQIDSGVHSNTSTLMGNERKSYQYNVLNEASSVTDTDLVPQSNETVTSLTTTASYDSLGRMTQLVDPERGTHSYTYDADGRMIADVSGSRTLGYSYDLLGRLGCIQDQSPTLSATGACTSGANPFVQNTYDTNILGTQGSTDFPIGRLTQTKATNYFPGPDYTQGYVTEQMQYDNRGRLTNETLQISASGGSLTFPSFPTYQLALSYNDADQPTTTTTSSNPSGLGYTYTNFYDSITGAPTGLGTNTSSANLATLSYTLNALPNTFSFQTSTGTALAQEQFSYDNNLRVTTATASWQSGSGSSGTIYSQALGYDAASNITSSTTTQAVVSGANNSGGSETEIYCYDEQNRLVWAGNSGTPQGASNGTCGSGTPSNSLSNATYSTQYVYTHLGQLWQGPYNGSGSYQYLYCNSSQPHQLTGLYPTGTTCSTTGGKTQSYAASYDSWGNMTTRTASGTGGTTATLSYDGQDYLMRWNDTNTTTNEEWYLYDASGERILRRSQTGTGNSNTKYTITVFGLEDHIYDGGGTNLNNKYYYSLAGRLIGLNNSSINFLFSDALGSVVSSISNTANSASVKGNQVYGPYGNNPYSKGTMGTTKGYTGQYNDSLTQLDYYGARYYDPFVGIFLSADKVQGNLQGMDPYSYVGENPETHTDPTGNYYSNGVPITQQGGAIGYITANTITTVINDGVGSVWTADNQFSYTQGSLAVNTYTHQQAAQYGGYDPLTDAQNSPGAKLSHELGLDTLQQTWNDPNASWQDKLAALGQFGLTNLNNALQLAMIFGGPEDEVASSVEEEVVTTVEEEVSSASEKEASSLLEKEASSFSEETGECGPLSFTPTTPVATSHGEQAIGTMKVGEKVWAYNPKTHKMELQPVQHVWINHDNDLVDLTLTVTIAAKQGKGVFRTGEIIHTNKKHPFLTKEKGFLPVGQITVGMHVLRANGTYGVVTGWKVVPGTKVMYNLEVAQDHTFTVGNERWVVHNASCPVKDLNPLHSPQTSGSRPDLENLSDQELLDSVNNPKNGDPIRINTQTGRVVDGNGRAYELLRRASLPGSSITPDTPIYYEPYTPSSIPEPWEEPPDLWDLLNGE